jgi:hypothetical protein
MLGRNRSIAVRETIFSLRSAADRADYKTDYRVVGRSWTPLDNVSPKTANSRAIWTPLDDSGQRAECSKTAGYRFDSCPTCPWEPSIYGACCSVSPAHFVCVDPYVTPISYHQERHRRCMSAALLVMDSLVQQRAPVAYAQSLAT